MVAQSGFEPLISSLWGLRVNQTSLPRNLEIENHSLEKQSSKGETKAWLITSGQSCMQTTISSRLVINLPCTSLPLHFFTLIAYPYSVSKLSRHIVCNLTNDFILYFLLDVSFKWLVGEDSNLYVERLVCGHACSYEQERNRTFQRHWRFLHYCRSASAIPPLLPIVHANLPSMHFCIFR